MQALQALSSATGVYCPLAQPLLGFLQWPGLRKKLPGMAGAAPKGSPTAPTLKAGDALLASSIWQQSLVEQVRLAAWPLTCLRVCALQPGAAVECIRLQLPAVRGLLACHTP